MIELALLQEAAQQALPRSAEAWAFIGTVFAAICAAVGTIFKKWSDRRLEESQREAKRENEAATRLASMQEKLVEVLERQVVSEREEKKLISQDNREQAATITKLGFSVDKLTDQGAQTIRLLEDVVYGRESASNRRRST